MTLRLVQVGMGDWGRNWATRVVQHSEDVQLVACVDLDPERLVQAQRLLPLPPERYFQTLGSALTAVEADAVLITTTLPAHVPVALEALNSEKHVLLEKPFAPTLAEAQQVVNTAAQHDRILMISQNYRFFPAVRAVAALVREEKLGEIGSVTIDFRRYKTSAGPQAQGYFRAWQPLLVDMAIHHFDLMRLVLGQEPVQVSCHAWNPPWSTFTDPAAAFATITFDGGAVVSYRGSWVSPGLQTCWSGAWRIECSEGEIAWTSRDETAADRVTIRPLGKRAYRVKLPAGELTDRRGSLQAFVWAVQIGQEPECSGRDNLHSLALMYAAVESASTHAPVSLHKGKQVS